MSPKTYGGPPDQVAQMPQLDQAIIAECDEAAVAVAADPSDRAARKRLHAAQALLRDRRKYWREVGDQLGTRSGLAIVNHVGEDGQPVLDTPEAQAYWAEVEKAAAAGVPWSVTRAMGKPEHGGPQL